LNEKSGIKVNRITFVTCDSPVPSYRFSNAFLLCQCIDENFTFMKEKKMLENSLAYTCVYIFMTENQFLFSNKEM
jgi:hypothetical protein